METYRLRITHADGRAFTVEMGAAGWLLALRPLIVDTFGLDAADDERWAFYLSGEPLDFDTELSFARRARAGTPEVSLESLGLAGGMRFIYAHDEALFDVDVLGRGEGGGELPRVVEETAASSTRATLSAGDRARIERALGRLNREGPGGIDADLAFELTGALYAITEAAGDAAGLTALGRSLGDGKTFREWVARAAEAVILAAPEVPGLAPLLRRWDAVSLVPGAALLVAQHLEALGATDEAVAWMAARAHPGTLAGDELALAHARLLARKSRLPEAEARIRQLLGRRWLSGRLRGIAERVQVELRALSGRTGEARGLERLRATAAREREERLQGTVRREGPKVGRNDPCPCGSGKKFKKCCG